MPAISSDLEVTVVTQNADATQRLGAALARVAEPGDVIALSGDLGAGKTQLAKGFGAGLGIGDTINSPSFVLMAEYDGRLHLFHQDLYRLRDASDAIAGGLVDDRQGEGVTVIEWPERMGDALPAARLEIRIAGSADDPRTLAIRATDERYRRYLVAATAAEAAT